MSVKGKRILITGGSSGLGKAMARQLIEKGAKVAITGRDKQKLEAVAKELNAYAIPADVSKEEEVKSTFVRFLEEFKCLDILINNAGVGTERKSIDELDINAMRKVYDINVFGAAMMGKEAAKLFKMQKHGAIVNIASTAAMKGYAGGTVYSSSKFALRGMSQDWQADLRPYNVRVINVNPSYVPTAFNNPSRQERAEEDNKLTANEIAHAVVAALEMDPRGYIPEVTVHATNPF